MKYQWTFVKVHNQLCLHIIDYTRCIFKEKHYHMYIIDSWLLVYSLKKSFCTKKGNIFLVGLKWKLYKFFFYLPYNFNSNFLFFIPFFPLKQTILFLISFYSQLSSFSFFHSTQSNTSLMTTLGPICS